MGTVDTVMLLRLTLAQFRAMVVNAMAQRNQPPRTPDNTTTATRRQTRLAAASAAGKEVHCRALVYIDTAFVGFQHVVFRQKPDGSVASMRLQRLTKLRHPVRVDAEADAYVRQRRPWDVLVMAHPEARRVMRAVEAAQ